MEFTCLCVYICAVVPLSMVDCVWMYMYSSHSQGGELYCFTKRCLERTLNTVVVKPFQQYKLGGR